ncbi:interferon-induced helicase C domain-containing protein 1-like isoform X2 [Mytilus californianus]|uniref:interferon-induced helicase C domain-containing protein 1-like isoform X2 n=1 Tax=Mytilus californianus TaxID=6549 RepID=UPI002246AC96|nr:interferon-induced helicase C domain-containing protein 1-like isoform X2 [Mytilus californianus]
MENDLRERIKFLLPEFQKFLKPTDVLFHIQGLSVELQEKICENEKRSRTEAVALLINAVSVNENLTEKFVVALSDGGYQRFIDLINKEYPDRGDKFCQDYYEFLICYMKGDLLERIEPLDICGFLYQNKCLELSDMEAIRSECNSNGKFQAFQELFFMMQRRRDNWPGLFMEALKESGREDLKAKMDPGATPEELERTGVTVGLQQNQDVPITEIYTRVSDDQTAVKRVVTPVHDNDDEEELSEQLSAVGLAEDGDKAGLDSDYEDEKYTKEGTEKEFSKPKKIMLRDYQLELAEKALTGKNTVICADTGSGKTWVALHIVQEHIDKLKLKKESPKVAFMARTNPLVQQQYTLFKYFLGEKMVYIINKDEKTTVPLKKLMEIYDVFFFTPQILINNIEKGDTRIPQFTLLILDECHHTAKGEPYNNLMRKYIKTKHRNENIPLPQIVGLTASIGVGAATTEDGAITHMIKIFSNLDVHEISTVERNKEEMKKFVAIPTEEHVKMEVSYEDPCKSIIEEEMKQVENIYENLMKRKGVLNTRQNLPGGDYLSKTYLGSIIKLKNQIMCDTTLPENTGREMICCLTHLGILHEALDINYLMNVEHVVQFLNKKYVEENQQPDRLIAIERRLLNFGKDLIRTFKKQTNIRPNPNLRLIEEKLQELYSESGKESLGMIFVQTRATAKSLAEYLNEKLEGLEIPVKPFIGSKSSETSDGLSETEKKELLEDFRSHKIKLLVATSVGSEGIDVPECNIVMKYNYSGNEINIIQMRGRTRKAGGQAIYISDQSVLRRDLVSMEKAAVMHRALDELKQKGKDEIRAMILTEQKNDLKHQEDQEKKLRDLQNQKKRGLFKLVCATCKETEINGDNIKLYKQNHHVAAEREFLDRVKKEDIKEQKINQMIRKSIIYCKKCPQKLGKIFLIHDLEVPLLKIDAFLCKEGDKLRKYKNWKFVPYIIDEISHKDLEIIFPKLTTPEVS